MRVEVLLWLMANAVSFVVSIRDFYETHRVWKWAREFGDRDDQRVSGRSFRLSLARFAMACLFLSAGIVAVTFFPNTIIPWILLLAAVVLTIDIIADARYRQRTFYSRLDQRKGKNDAMDR